MAKHSHCDKCNRRLEAVADTVSGLLPGTVIYGYYCPDCWCAAECELVEKKV